MAASTAPTGHPSRGNAWLWATSPLRSPLEEGAAVDRNPFAVPDSGGGERMLEVLRPFIAQEDPASSYRQIVYGNGQADVYLLDDGMMANHVSGASRVRSGVPTSAATVGTWICPSRLEAARASPRLLSNPVLLGAFSARSGRAYGGDESRPQVVPGDRPVSWLARRQRSLDPEPGQRR